MNGFAAAFSALSDYAVRMHVITSCWMFWPLPFTSACAAPKDAWIAAATAFFLSTLENTGVTPYTVTINKTATCLSALASVFPEVEHLTGKAEP